MRTARTASSCATFCGVQTITAPVSFSVCDIVSGTSPVPGGRMNASTRKTVAASTGRRLTPGFGTSISTPASVASGINSTMCRALVCGPNTRTATSRPAHSIYVSAHPLGALASAVPVLPTNTAWPCRL